MICLNCVQSRLVKVVYAKQLYSWLTQAVILEKHYLNICLWHSQEHRELTIFIMPVFLIFPSCSRLHLDSDVLFDMALGATIMIGFMKFLWWQIFTLLKASQLILKKQSFRHILYVITSQILPVLVLFNLFNG